MTDGEQTVDVFSSMTVDLSNTTRLGELADVALTGPLCSAVFGSTDPEFSAKSLTMTLRFCASVDGHIFLTLVTFTICVLVAVCGPEMAGRDTKATA